MPRRFVVPVTSLIAALSFLPSQAAAQTLLAAEKHPATVKWSANTSWTKRTPDGQPDIKGNWSNATITPFERPVALGTKPFLTEEVAAKADQRAAQNKGVDRPARPGDVGDYNALWLDSGTRVVKTRQ